MIALSPFQKNDPLITLNEILERRPLYDSFYKLDRAKHSLPFFIEKVNDKMKSNANQSSQNIFKKDAFYWAAPDSIGFLSQMQQILPETEFVISGVKSWDSNCRCGDENVNIDYLTKVYDCLADLVVRNTSF